MDEVTLPDDVPDELKYEIRDILSRIPLEWGRLLRVEKGWYPLIADCNRLMRRVAPSYVVYQVKEKFGHLRYYMGLPDLPRMVCCYEFEKIIPRPTRTSWNTSDPDADKISAEWDTYDEMYKQHVEEEDHKIYTRLWEPIYKDRREIQTILQAIADSFEAKSKYVCELCGQWGQTRNRSRYYIQTLCDACFEEVGEKVENDG